MKKPESVPPNPAASHGDTPLWQQLQQVAAVMQKVEAGASATTALEAVPAALRPGVQALVFETLRGLGVGRLLCSQLVQRRPAPLLQALLHSALVLAWQAGAQREDSRGYTDFTLVNQAVEAAKRHPKLRHSAAMVNAVLRRYLREQAALRQAVQQASARAALQRVARLCHAQGECDQGQGRGQGEAEEGGQKAGQSGAHEADAHAHLARRRAG